MNGLRVASRRHFILTVAADVNFLNEEAAAPRDCVAQHAWLSS